jgi:hypothetical protein
MTNYKAPVKVSAKKRLVRGLGITLVFISLGLMIVGADQLGQHLQEHRAGFSEANR